MLRTWPALFAWGAGLIHLAIGASVVGTGHDAFATALLVSLLVAGAAELAWGVMALRSGRIVGGKGAALGAIALVLLGAASLLSGASVIAVAAASALAVAGGSIAARTAAPTASRAVAARGRGTWSRGAGVMVGAVLVAALVAPGLAQTDAGQGVGEHGHGIGAELPLIDPHAHH